MSYRASVTYAAPPRAVFEAAAQPGGPNGWWTTSGDVASRAGERVRLNWSSDDYVVFRVDLFERPGEMRWACVEQHDTNLELPDEWVGTTLLWSFHADGDGTRLDFVHEGLVPQLDCYEVCENGWDHFLRRSLKQLVEAGHGLPYQVV